MILIQTLRLLSIFLILFSFPAGNTLAANNIAEMVKEGPSFTQLHAKWTSILNQAERQIKKGRLEEQTANHLREQISKVREEALATSINASDKIIELRKLYDALGPLPKEGEPEEAPEVARERLKLERQLREVEGQVKQSDLIVQRSDLLLKQISTIEIGQIVSNLSEQAPLPLDPRVWMKAGYQFVNGYKSLSEARRKGGYRSPLLTVAPFLVVGIFLAMVAGLWIRRRLLYRLRRDASIENPTYSHKVLAAFGVGISRGMIPVVIFVILSGIVWTYWMKEELDPSLKWPWGIFYGVIFYFLGAALVRAIFSPRLPQWNLTWVRHASAKKIAHRLHLLVAVIAVGIAFEAVLADTGRAPEFGSIYAFIKNTIISVILLSLTRKALWEGIELVDEEQKKQAESTSLWFWPYLRLITALTAFTALICSILGFHNIADFILPRIVLTNLLVAVFVTIRVLIREALAYLLEGDSRFAHSFREMLALKPETGKRLNFWLMTFVDLFAILAACYVLLILWRFPHQDIVNWFSGWFKGFSIGSYTFSLADLILAFFVLFLVITLTRVIRSLLENRLLPQTSMDIGVRTAISSGVGYLGFLIAILMAMSTLGLDLTKLALIAGALSVGIGFGLQNIVNNFVSGLVLLFERPIKIGDWVVVGNLEGKVKQINVRSTEIETFNRASVIIPNSDLLQTAVVNWTHKSAFGRIEVPVGVAYGSDIEQVENLLLESAREQSEVLSWPAPFVYFIDFGESSLDFQLYAYVENIERRKRIVSDIRKNIMIKFRQAGIEIPFPQRVVTLNSESSERPEIPEQDETKP